MSGKVQTTCGYNDLETCPEKMIQNSVSRKYGTDLHLVIASLIVLRAARAQAPAPPPAYPAAAPPALRWPPAHSAVPPHSAQYSNWRSLLSTRQDKTSFIGSKWQYFIQAHCSAGERYCSLRVNFRADTWHKTAISHNTTSPQAMTSWANIT